LYCGLFLNCCGAYSGMFPSSQTCIPIAKKLYIPTSTNFLMYECFIISSTAAYFTRLYV